MLLFRVCLVLGRPRFLNFLNNNYLGNLLTCIFIVQVCFIMGKKSNSSAALVFLFRVRLVHGCPVWLPFVPGVSVGVEHAQFDVLLNKTTMTCGGATHAVSSCFSSVVTMTRENRARRRLCSSGDHEVDTGGSLACISFCVEPVPSGSGGSYRDA